MINGLPAPTFEIIVEVMINLAKSKRCITRILKGFVECRHLRNPLRYRLVEASNPRSFRSQSCEQRGSGRCANRLMCVGPVEHNTPLCQVIDVRRIRLRIPIDSEVGSKVIDDNQQNIFVIRYCITAGSRVRRGMHGREKQSTVKQEFHWRKHIEDL